MNEIFSMIITILCLLVAVAVFIGGFMLTRSGGLFGSIGFKTIIGFILILLSIFYICISIANMLYCKNPQYNCKWYDLQNVFFWEKNYWQHLF